ncbi:uncharacterized protein LOC110104414 [Dendrobium catenatum]|uniref:uncharacterized protein LOC110104414 n=1 Tax=Dendrobium catenatum TaxID=906689 RepID=UPI0009F21371|nr:uncharacterized protein LOC110104414 [Dendrobium catenatum]
MAWSRGVWFLLGRPFVLQKWHPKFKPIKEEFSSVPIWVKIHDLPLACWNSEGISRIASKIGIPVAADKLTEQKTRLTFARVCVLVDNQANYPDEIKVSLDGDIVALKVQYEWHPIPCEHCKSLMHASFICPKIPKMPSEAQDRANTGRRGRSFSRKPHSQHSSRNPNSSRPPVINPQPEPQLNCNNSKPTPQKPNTEHINTTALSSSKPAVIMNAIGQAMHFQPHSPTSQKVPPKSAVDGLPESDPPLSEDAVVSGIPNLNSPHETISSSSVSKIIPSKDIISPNKFDIPNSEEVISSHLEERNEVNLGSTAGGNAKNVDKGKQTQDSLMLKKLARGKQSKKPQSRPNS